MATGVHDKEKTLYRQVAQKVEAGMPDVEVLALELTGRERFASTSTTRAGSTTRSARA